MSPSPSPIRILVADDNEDHRFLVSEQAEELQIPLQSIVLEPEGRNTAPARASDPRGSSSRLL